MFALLNPTVWLVALALMLSSYAGGRWQQYQSDHKAQVAELLKSSEQARAKEQAWQLDAQTIEEVHSEELRRVAAQHVRDLDGVRGRSARLPDAAQQACAGASPAALSAPDAAVLIGYAAEFDGLRADYQACKTWIETVTEKKP
jgi:hypothetical protein